MSHATTQHDTVRQLLRRARTGHEDVLTDDSLDSIQAEIERALYDGASATEIEQATINALTARLERDPAFGSAAAAVHREQSYRLAVDPTFARNSVDPTHTEFVDTYRDQFTTTIDRCLAEERLDERMAEFDIDRLSDALVPARDLRFDYMALDTLDQRYYLRTPDGERLELPQIFWMRVAMGLALREAPSERDAYAIEFYELLSTLRFIPSTPTLFHAGTTHPQLSSCYLTTVQDDLDDIFDSYKAHANLSKWSGGIGTDWTNLRAAGALIESTGVESTGTVPFLKISNDVTAAINRSGKRRGAACAYLEAWHLDFPAFLDLRRNTGDDRRRTHDMNTAAWIPDLFMKRVEADEQWTLFSPDEVPELHGSYGQAFEEQYLTYEARAEVGELRQFERVDAADLWRQLLTRLFETGHPWITFKDPCNIRSPQDHAGTIHSSNLCTEITLNTAADETAVCNLGSVNLSNHVTADEIQREKLSATIETAMRMLDNVVDLNFYPTDRAERSNMKHRPVGLGMMGFHDALMQLGVPLDSADALEITDAVTEQVAYHAISGSVSLAAERGSYESFAGSKWDRGLLPQDTIDLLETERGEPIEVEYTERLPWDELRERISRHGIRNSNTMAIAPTATISTIAGTTPSIEPIYSNLYVKSNMSGDFTVVNERLIADLKARDLWTDGMLDRLKYHDGSIQEIGDIPADVRELYRGAFEIDPRHQLRLTAQRGVWIDQSQSHNVFFPSTDGSLLDSVYRTAWKLGLKTTYYLRTLGASSIEKSTIDMNEYDDTARRSSQENDDGGTDRCDLPTVADPTCDACQ